MISIFYILLYIDSINKYTYIFRSFSLEIVSDNRKSFVLKHIKCNYKKHNTSKCFILFKPLYSYTFKAFCEQTLSLNNRVSVGRLYFKTGVMSIVQK